MKIDERKLCIMSGRDNILILYLNRKYVEESGFQPGSDVNIVYDSDKIMIVKEIKKIEV